MKLLPLALVSCALLSGCSTFSSDEFSCGGKGIYKRGVCMDAKRAYEAAEQGKDVRDFVMDKTGNVKPKTDVANHGQPDNKLDPRLEDVAPVVAPMRTPILQPKPLLMPATVAEIWVNAFEDERGYLHLPSTVFVEVTPRRWSLDATNIETYEASGPFTVVRPTKRDASASTAQ